MEYGGTSCHELRWMETCSFDDVERDYFWFNPQVECPQNTEWLDEGLNGGDRLDFF